MDGNISKKLLMKEGLTMDKITRDNWPESWGRVSAWTEVSEEIYEHFLNVLPPLNYSYPCPYFQCSEPYSHGDNNGKWQGKYLTFTKQDGKCWFLGINFPGQYPKKEVPA
jgi:hypothetical protein